MIGTTTSEAHALIAAIEMAMRNVGAGVLDHPGLVEEWRNIRQKALDVINAADDAKVPD